jgi:hypothetical protein
MLPATIGIDLSPIEPMTGRVLRVFRHLRQRCDQALYKPASELSSNFSLASTPQIRRRPARRDK